MGEAVLESSTHHLSRCYHDEASPFSKGGDTTKSFIQKGLLKHMQELQGSHETIKQLEKRIADDMVHL